MVGYLEFSDPALCGWPRIPFGLPCSSRLPEKLPSLFPGDLYANPPFSTQLHGRPASAPRLVLLESPLRARILLRAARRETRHRGTATAAATASGSAPGPSPRQQTGTAPTAATPTRTATEAARPPPLTPVATSAAATRPLPTQTSITGRTRSPSILPRHPRAEGTRRRSQRSVTGTWMRRSSR